MGKLTNFQWPWDPNRSHISHFAAIRMVFRIHHMDVFTEESRPSAFNGIMQQYSCKGATQVPFFRFFTWKVCSLAEVHRKNLMLRINWENRCHFGGKSSQSFQSDFPPFWIPFGSEKIVPLETCLQYPHDLCETIYILGFVSSVIWFIFPIGNPSELGNRWSEYVLFLGDPKSANPSSYPMVLLENSPIKIPSTIQRSARWMKSPRFMHGQWSWLVISMIFPKFGYYI
jgi:hypothetical protein